MISTMYRLNKVILLFFLFLHSAFGQPFLNQNIDKENINFKSLQAAFNSWASDKNLSETKGWKWFKRWENHYAQRANPDGTLPDPVMLFQEALKYNNLKASRSNSSNNWLPMGPNTLPSSPNPTSGHGMARINCIAFHPSNSNIFWVGVAQGGIWKTTDNGFSWTPLDDGLPILRVSDIAVDPNDPDIIYACLGDYEYNGVSLSPDDPVCIVKINDVAAYKTLGFDGSCSISHTILLEKVLDQLAPASVDLMTPSNPTATRLLVLLGSISSFLNKE